MASSIGAAAARTLWSRATAIPAEYPFTFGVVFSGFKTSFSDLLVQKVVEQREEVDWKRNAAFATFGFIYLGGVQYMIYVPLFSRMFPTSASYGAKSLRDKLRDTRGTMELTAQVLLDQFFHNPFMYFPAFYCTRELIMSKNPNLSRCLNDYRKNIKEDMIAFWKIWFPATVLNFAFMPMYLRVPFVAGVSLVWTCILSAMRGGDVTHGEEMAGGAVTGATLTMVEEGLGGLFTSTIELDPTKNHMMITASGRDKPGWVALLSRAVADAGGSISQSKMVRLGTEFIILMHVAITPEQQKKLMSALRHDAKLKPLNVQCNHISRRKTGTYDEAVMGVRIRCVGADRPGMLASLSESIWASGLSIENVSTELKRGPGGRLDFIIDADCVTTTHMDHDSVHDMVASLSSLKESLKLDVMDVRVQRLVLHGP